MKTIRTILCGIAAITMIVSCGTRGNKKATSEPAAETKAAEETETCLTAIDEYLTKVIGIGATYCLDPRVYTYYEKPSTKEGLICRLGETSHTLMLHLKINWLNTKYVNLYSKVGQGIMAWGYNLKEYRPDLYQINLPSNKFIDRIDYAYQFVPIGVEIGTKQYAGFIQCGLGMEGIISIGFRYGLKDKE